MQTKTKKIIWISVFAVVVVALCVCIGLTIYYGTMTSYSFNYTVDGSYKEAPSEYYKKADQQGEIVMIEYETSTYYSVDALNSHQVDPAQFEDYKTREDETLTKPVYIYLPYGYDANDTTTKYDILYHIHGTTCDGTTLINGVGKDSDTKNLLDNMIQNGEMKPTIVAFPTWYNGNDLDDDDPDYLTAHFYYEFRNDIMPAVEQEFNTYAGLTSSMTDEEIDEAFVESRGHRACSGYSRGGTTCWYVFAELMEYFKYYNPISGDYLGDFFDATDEKSYEKAGELVEKIEAKGYGPDDFYVEMSVGAIDFAYLGVHSQAHGMLRHPEMFEYGSNYDTSGNMYVTTAEGVWHTDTNSPKYFYNSLWKFFD